MTSIRVRTATPGDAAAITAVHLASRAAAMPWLPGLHTDEEARAWICDVVLPGSRVWVAEEPGAEDDGGTARAVGFAALDGDVLDQLYLLPEVRRRGIGTLLLQTAQAASPRGLTLHVFARNAAARAFYAHHGFEVGATDDGSGNEEGLPDVTCRWAPSRFVDPTVLADVREANAACARGDVTRGVDAVRALVRRGDGQPAPIPRS